MSAESTPTISVDQLQIGIYIYLDVGWMNHPFSFSKFKIRSEEQLKAIKDLGIETVRWSPALSDTRPQAKGAASPSSASPTPEEAARMAEQAKASAEMMARKHERIAHLTKYRENICRIENSFSNAASVVRNISKTIYAQPQKTVSDAYELIGTIVDDLLVSPEIAIQVMAEKSAGEDVYFHSLNVSVLSMILARELKLPADLIKIVGVGGLFHDLGLSEIPSTILNNPGRLTKAEKEFREQHCQYGLNIGKKAGLPQQVLNIIMQHHERFDGSGYPKRLKGDEIDPLARIISIANDYDNLCNPFSPANALTPHEALAHMFAQNKSAYDPRLLQAFIRFMGVYPPGTIVGLSNDTIGLVIEINAARPLKPAVIIYDPVIPKTEAMILDLEHEEDVNISRAIRPSQLPHAIFEYLNPRRRVSYYFDAGQKSA